MNSSRPIVEALNDALPQTQCTRCGFADCRNYAEAIAAGSAAINQCPPGGAEGVRRLSTLTGRPALPLNPGNGREGPRHLAVIDEAWCIGCTLCLQACPVDCIIGAPKAMHTVIDGLCTGCELCIPVCPVDCIALVEVAGERTGWQAWNAGQALEARRRYAAHRARTAQLSVAAEQTEPLGSTRAHPEHVEGEAHAAANADSLAAAQHSTEEWRRRGLIDAALARARAARTGR